MGEARSYLRIPTGLASADYLDLLCSILPLNFVGGPMDGKTITWVGKLPIKRFVQQLTSHNGTLMADTYQYDPDDPTMRRMVYAGREVVASGGRARQKRRRPSA